MLLECPDCHGKVSSRAPACPHCGLPFRGVDAADASERGGEGAGERGEELGRREVQTIERTGKTWKGLQLAGGLLFVVGGCGAVQAPPDGSRTLLVVVALGGIIMYLYGRMGAWWHHG